MQSISVFEAAKPSSDPLPSGNRFTGLVMALVLGFVAAGGIIFVLEHLDESIKSPDELKSLTGFVSLGGVIRHQARKGAGRGLLSDEQIKSSLGESYKFIRTNLEFAALEGKGFRTILVTSPSPLEGKSTTAANIAISAAQEGATVILIDADLRRPSLHTSFNVSKNVGLTNVLLGSVALDAALIPTSVANLKILTSGPLPPDPAPILRSKGLQKLTEELKSRAQLVVFDCGPILAVTDPLMLVSLVDAVVFVVDARKTKRGAAKQAAEMLRQANPAIVGAVVNKVPRRRPGYYSHYYYYSYSHYYGYSSNGDGKSASSEKSGTIGKLAARFVSNRRTHGAPHNGHHAGESAVQSAAHAKNGSEPKRRR